MKWKRGAALVAVFAASFVITVGPALFDQVMRSCDAVFPGFAALMYGFVWLILICPLTGLCLWLSRKFPKTRVYLLWGLLPAVAGFLIDAPSMRFTPISPRERLESRWDIALPASAHAIRASFLGGPVIESHDVYYFECDPADTARLIKACGFDRPTGSGYVPQVRDPEKWPEPSTWKGLKVYMIESSAENPRTRALALCTDESLSRVYLVLDSY